MEEPTQDQVDEALRLIDDHLATCEEDPCPGIDRELAAIHPAFARMSSEMSRSMFPEPTGIDYADALEEELRE